MQKKDSDSICQDQVFDRVYNDLIQSVYHFIYYKCGNQSTAEDIAQEAFLKLWENCSTVSQDKAKAFLFTVAKNIFLNKVNKQKVALKFEQQYQMGKEKETPEFLLEQEEFHQKLMDAINQLPENQREVFLLNRIDKLKYREIAELLGISQKAVEKRMHNALLHLRKVHKKI